MVVVAYKSVQLFQQTVTVNGVASERTKELPEAGKDLLGGETGHLDRRENTVTLHRFQCFGSHDETTTIAPATDEMDDAGFIHVAQFLMETDELDVRTPEIHGQILVVHLVVSTGFFKNCRE